MKIIEQIVDDCVSETAPLAHVLRKLLVIADRLANLTLKDWVLGELNGYHDQQDLPDYRIVSAPATGMFIGFSQIINDQPLVGSVMDVKYQHFAREVKLRQGIASLESLLLSKSDGNFQIPWPAELVAKYQSSFMKGYTLNRAHQNISKSIIVGILSVVRTKALQLALDIQREIGIFGDRLKDVPEERINNTVTNIIFGGQNVLSSSVRGGLAQSGGGSATVNDAQLIAQLIRSLDLPDKEAQALESALAEDSEAAGTRSIGKAVREWVDNAVRSIATRTKSQATSAMGDALLNTIRQTLGI